VLKHSEDAGSGGLPELQCGNEHLVLRDHHCIATM
jgi:hypothetical protein